MTERESVLVLYGSQTGNSEQAAKDLCSAASRTLPSVEFEPLQLDDFLELRHSQYTRLIVIIVSSYGVGGAPLGAYRFRDLCDYWKATPPGKVLDGLSFCMCGLGDSKYTTFFENPTTIHSVLVSVGAKFYGELGKADMSGTGENEQPKVIERWIQKTVPVLKTALAQPKPSNERLEEMQQATVAVSKKINPDYRPQGGDATNNGPMIFAVAVALIAAYLYYHFLEQKSRHHY